MATQITQEHYTNLVMTLRKREKLLNEAVKTLEFISREEENIDSEAEDVETRPTYAAKTAKKTLDMIKSEIFIDNKGDN